ncbi:MAG: STAS/SEC14 domain-containing protein [Thiotrichaceae bacterium]|nr:STAS/SEC14 domain-containing protein [Thiotrichaceae bacterium]
MTSKKFHNFMLRIYDEYVEINKSSHGEADDMDMFEMWDFLEETFKLPIPVLSTQSKCYSVSPEAQLQFSKTAKKYYSAIALIDKNKIDIKAENVDNNFFLEDVEIQFFDNKDEAINWLKGFGPVETL